MSDVVGAMEGQVRIRCPDCLGVVSCGICCDCGATHVTRPKRAETIAAILAIYRGETPECRTMDQRARKMVFLRYVR